ncbi:hypothetical protein [Actinoplanes philippinensis]|uniref:hypothetical protein n=1 Tax=Actinoplanes philippinensis TaxID=35752 RepID=UPI0033CEB732
MTKSDGRCEQHGHHDGTASWHWLVVVLAAALVGVLGYRAEGVFAGITAAIATAGVGQQFLK